MGDSGKDEWEAHCMRWRGRILTGKWAHCCFDWDDLPVDETTREEFQCCNCEWDGEKPPLKGDR